MKIVADTHTHTVASGHAFSTLNENIKWASEIGLKVLAMTDHTPGMPGGAHAFHFSNLKILPKTMYGVRLLKGAEANIMNYEGKLDMPDEELKGLDYVIASLHPPCIPFASKEEVTKGIEKIMENPWISTIGHPGDNRYPMDFEKIVKKAKETGTLLELNNASLKPTSFRPGVKDNMFEMLKYCKKYEASIVLGTDAHFFQDIGQFKEALELLEEVQFPSKLVANAEENKLEELILAKRLK